MLSSGMAARVLRVMAAAAVAAATLAAPICPALAQGEHVCCCAHDEARQAQDEVQTPPCGCAESAPEGHPSNSPASAASAGSVDVPPARVTPQLEMPVAVLDTTHPAPVLARPPPLLFHIETVVLRR